MSSENELTRSTADFTGFTDEYTTCEEQFHMVDEELEDENTFWDMVNDRGQQCVLLFPPIRRGDWEPAKREMEKFEKIPTKKTKKK